MELELLLARVLNRATDISSLDVYGGMASLSMVWNPYEARWDVEVSWSSAHRIHVHHDKLWIAAEQMHQLLDEEFQRLKG